MLFNSEPYLVFLPAVVALNWVLPARLRPAFLLAASYYFYASWSPPFLLLIFGLTIANYLIGLRQGASSSPRRAWFVLALAFDLGALGVFKYLGLLDARARSLLSVLGLPADLPSARIVLPLGLSFFTFEFIHYQVEVLRGRPGIRDPIRFALFPAFFPTQIAGPIKRYQDFDRQVAGRPRFDPELALGGAELIARGLFKKVVLADSLLPIATTVFAHPGQATLLDAWTGLLAFYLQVYFDFSGYTDIGRGSAQLLGYRIPVNFDAPYLCSSLREYWSRWHITLSMWLRDYLYIPLGGSRGGPGRTRFNLLVTMSLGGLWHGAGWHFMAWGAGWAGVLVGERAWAERVGARLRVAGAAGILLGWLVTQSVVLAGYVVFRSANLRDAARLARRLLAGTAGYGLVSGRDLAIVALVGGGLLGTQLVTRNVGAVKEMMARAGAVIVLRPAYVMALLAVFTIFFGSAARGTPNRFFYFQF